MASRRGLGWSSNKAVLATSFARKRLPRRWMHKEQLMPGCVLRVRGPYPAVARAVEKACVTFHEGRGSVRQGTRSSVPEGQEATFNYTVSVADGDHVPVQIAEAEVFVRQHLPELTELLAAPGIEHAELDFGWDVSDAGIGQMNPFPSSFLAVCAKAGLDIEVSVYVVEELPR